MNRQLTARSSLENFRKEAKRWLKDLRAHDAAAWERLRRVLPDARAAPSLRDVQHALAREHSLASWAALKLELSANALARSGDEKLLAEFLEHSCIHYGIRPSTSTWNIHYRDEPSRWHYAARILSRHPSLVRDSIHAAAVSGDVAQVERILSRNPAAVHAKGGPQAWEPLLYVCYGRLPLPEASQNAPAIARRLLDAGANVMVRLNADPHDFGPLTGAIGEGEFSQPRHPQAVVLAELLIERGADPYDPQALYNTSLEGDDVFWLDFLYERSARSNGTHKWTATSSSWPQSGMLDYLIGNAVTRSALERARWLLARGADPNTTHYYTKRKVHTEARLLGFVEMAELLQHAGAVPETLRGRDEFRAACMRADLEAIAALAHAHPEYLQDGACLIHAAGRDLVDVARLLLDLGMSPDVRDVNNYSPLHAAGIADAVRVGTLLVERGAEIDPQEKRFNGTPLTWAIFGKAQRMTAFLGDLSHSPKSLVSVGNLERLRELLVMDPSLARTTDRNGSLFAYLPDDEDRATEIAELLLAHGADPLLKGDDGANAIERLDKRGLEDVAEMLRSHKSS
jgi:uncharacterized protein